MVAHNAAQSDSADAVALEMATAMQAHAAAGEWDLVDELAVRIRTAISRVPERRRRDVILAVERHLEQVQSRVQNSRQEIADQLSAIRRGQDATRAYSGKD